LTIPSPPVALSNVARNRIDVLLPAPFGPMNPNNSPASIFRLKLSTASSSPYRFVKFSSSIMEWD
jgi:hypothetical protein